MRGLNILKISSSEASLSERVTVQTMVVKKSTYLACPKTSSSAYCMAGNFREENFEF